MSQIVSIAYKPEHVEHDPPDRYVRIMLDEATLVVGHGIAGDRKGGNPNRQLNVMAAEMLAELNKHGFNTRNGQMGEQIVIEGIDLKALQPGDQLQLGETTIEVVKERTGCDRFKHIQSKEGLDTAGMLGVMAKVVTGGNVRVGDPVKASQPSPQNV